MTKYWLWGCAGVCLWIVGRCAARERHPLRTLLAGALCGVGTLATLALLAPVTGVDLPLNRFTGFVAVVLGLPGVTALLLVQLLL
ncbi:pro-sigmaK processing inhibitor BofA family protein [uncultured Subdoligranulum sp.]|uniref:pro-sigmaK processing inhibitor BofA family protein n=1 Tax=uncultured Subdoligranulum sp. TaxID=512298 RepID=UPI00344BDA76